mmetsp:Transcript_5231/g.11643  ORF Transcript_5231/g.11643 Transcript_5231/m.11643 type:complete len:106 (+) Transcript_5231:72-389(+)
MASFMFTCFLASQYPRYEERVDHELEGKQLVELWRELEGKCYNKYIGEVDDDQQGVHPYQILKWEVQRCKRHMQHDNRREILQECHARIVKSARSCQAIKLGPDE